MDTNANEKAKTLVLKIKQRSHYSQQALSRELRVSRTTIGNWETGRNPVTLEAVSRMVNLNLCSVDEALVVLIG